MTILKNVEIYWTKLDPEKPVANQFATEAQPKPKRWELQIRTTDKEVRKAWKALGIDAKAKRADKTDDESEILYYYTSFSKNSVNKDGKKIPPVTVVDAKNRDFVDVNTIGNGSVANLRLLSREFKNKAGEEKLAWTLMGVQLLKLKVYEGGDMEGFDESEEEMEILPPDAEKSSDDAADSDEY